MDRISNLVAELEFHFDPRAPLLSHSQMQDPTGKANVLNPPELTSTLMGVPTVEANVLNPLVLAL